MNEIQLQQKHGCFMGYNLNLKHMTTPSTHFRNRVNKNYFHNNILFKKVGMILLSRCNYYLFASFYAVNNIYKAFCFTVNSLIQMISIKKHEVTLKAQSPIE